MRAVVVDRHPGTADQPKARGQMPPIMEAFRRRGQRAAFGCGPARTARADHRHL
ncbi:MAG: hypothetical protein ACRD0K_28125 [Egibacteraceae bacterium]